MEEAKDEQYSLMHCVNVARFVLSESPSRTAVLSVSAALDEIKEAKIRGIIEKEGEIEFLEMIMVNNINMIEEIQFAMRRKADQPPAEHALPLTPGSYKYYEYGKQGVDDLVHFYSQFSK